MINFYNVVDFSLVRSKELGPAVSSAILGYSVGSIVFLIFLYFHIFFSYNINKTFVTYFRII